MEFRYGLWSGISPLCGEDGRQIGETNTSPAVFKQSISTEIRPCKYSGSRSGDLINISALRTAMAHFYEASAITVAVRDYHMDQIGKPRSEQPGIWDLHVISRASLALIAYRYRGDKVSEGEYLSNDIASQYKMVTGLFVINREMMNSAFGAIRDNNQISAEELYRFADENDLYRSDTGMVCAGSALKITEFLDFANRGRDHPENHRLKLPNSNDHLKLLRRFVSNMEIWYRYALRTIELDYFVQLEIFRKQLENQPAAFDSIQPVLDICKAKHRYWVELLDNKNEFSNLSFQQGVLERQNAMLTLLDRPHLKTIPSRMLKARLR